MKPNAARTSIVLHEGKVLAAGAAASIRAARTRSLVRRELRHGNEPARLLQAKLIDRADVIDAVPQGGKVRTVMHAEHAALDRRTSPSNPRSPNLEDGLMMLLRRQTNAAAGCERRRSTLAEKAPPDRSEVVIETHDVVRKFGDFTAVNRTSFEVRRGEVFGLLGPNGAGKTTTFRMLCGLLPATSGTLHVAGADLRHARAEARQNIGYVAQKFSLYGDISMRENLEFFAGAYGLRGARATERIDWALENFELQQARVGDRPARCREDFSDDLRWLRHCCTSRRSCFSMNRRAVPIRSHVVNSGAVSPRWPITARPSSSRRTSWKKRNTAIAS